VELRGLSQREYATQAGLSISGAKSRVQRARAMLEGAVRACCDIEQDARGNVIGYVRKRDGASCGGNTCK
jgi:RNA polymerase sigma-70 factor, ECF subfamily